MCVFICWYRPIYVKFSNLEVRIICMQIWGMHFPSSSHSTMTLFVPKTKSSFKRSNDCINSCHRNHHLTLPKNLQFPLVLTKRGRQQWLRDKIHCRQCHLVWSFYFWSYSIFRYDRRSTPIKFWSDDCSRKWCRPSLGHHLLLTNRRRRFSWRKSNTPAWDMSKKELRSTWFGRYFDWDHDEVIYWSK